LQWRMITATYIVQNINKHLKLPINIMGLIMRYNGIDVQQTKHYIKIHCGKYIGKMTQAHLWLTTMPASHRMPLPFSSDKKTLAELLNCQTPATYQERLELERRMGIKYHHAMGDILYPMIKCHPDISAHVILLSQYMANGEPHHYLALKQLIQYLSVTADVGIHYWRKAPHSALPEAPLPSSHIDTYTLTELRPTTTTQLMAYVDSDWATNTKKRTFVTGMVLMYGGGAIAKMILFFRPYYKILDLSSTMLRFFLKIMRGHYLW
jgi:hypothetical protein